MCKAPIIDVNVRLKTSLLFETKPLKVSLSGQVYTFTYPYNVLFHKLNERLDILRAYANSDSYSSTLLLLSKTDYAFIRGRSIPLYSSYPCNKCPECRYKYQQSIVNRCLIEVANSSYVFFYTLTYSDEYLPKWGLEKSDVVKAFKRLRTLSSRYLNIDLDFTQVYVGEYGMDKRFTHRPHYHGLMFIRNNLTSRQLYLLRQLFYYNSEFYQDNCNLTPFWPFGRVDLQIARNAEATTRYVCKYITKSSFKYTSSDLEALREYYHGYYNPMFVQLPKRIGLANKYFDKYLCNILNSSDGLMSIVINGIVKRIGIPRIYINRLKKITSIPNCDVLFKYCVLVRLSDYIQTKVNCNTFILTKIRYFLDNYSYLGNNLISRRVRRNSNRCFDVILALSKHSYDLFTAFDDILNDLIECCDTLSEYLNDKYYNDTALPNLKPRTSQQILNGYIKLNQDIKSHIYKLSLYNSD